MQNSQVIIITMIIHARTVCNWLEFRYGWMESKLIKYEIDIFVSSFSCFSLQNNGFVFVISTTWHWAVVLAIIWRNTHTYHSIPYNIIFICFGNQKHFQFHFLSKKNLSGFLLFDFICCCCCCWMTLLQKFKMFKVKCDFPPHYFHLFACWANEREGERERKNNIANIVWNVTFKWYGVYKSRLRLLWMWLLLLLLSTWSNPFEILPRMWKLYDIIISVCFSLTNAYSEH